MFASVVRPLALGVGVFLPMVSVSVLAQSNLSVLPSVEIKALRPDVQPDAMNPEQEILPPVHDSADYLRSIPGVSISRFGGRGLDPTIRGQSQTRLNVFLDGAAVHGGCPNRMDPPTSFAASSGLDEVVVIKGVQTLEYGAGGTGGTILFNRKLETSVPGISGQLGLGTSSNALNYEANALLRMNGEKWYGLITAQDRDVGNYEDGDGRQVRSSFTESAFFAGVGLRINERDRLELSQEYKTTDDSLFPGAGMDAPEEELNATRVRYEGFNLLGVDRIEVKLSQANVDHLMDNYSLRPNSGTKLRVPSSSDTTTFDIKADKAAGEGFVTIGMQLNDNERVATRFMGPTTANVNMINSRMWPEVGIRQVGIFAQTTQPITPVTEITAGLRYDRVTASADTSAAAVGNAMLSTPDQLYSRFYGTTAQAGRHENNWSALLRMGHEMNPHWTAFGGLSRTMRTADATERYLASNGMMPTMFWVGNPDIDPEAHNQLDLGVRHTGANYQVELSAYYDHVTDYILRDRARANNGFVAPQIGATIYRNVTATLSGAELGWMWRINRWLQSDVSIAYVRGINQTDNRSLAQIPPLQGNWSLNAKLSKLTLTSELRFADQQSRVDTSTLTGSGLDAQQTPGWGILNLRAGWQVTQQTLLQLGIDNALDKTYAEHLNRANQDPFNPDPVQVNEPGRVVWAKVKYDF